MTDETSKDPQAGDTWLASQITRLFGLDTRTTARLLVAAVQRCGSLDDAVAQPLSTGDAWLTDAGAEAVFQLAYDTANNDGALPARFAASRASRDRILADWRDYLTCGSAADSYDGAPVGAAIDAPEALEDPGTCTHEVTHLGTCVACGLGDESPEALDDVHDGPDCPHGATPDQVCLACDSPEETGLTGHELAEEYAANDAQTRRELAAGDDSAIRDDSAEEEDFVSYPYTLADGTVLENPGDPFSGGSSYRFPLGLDGMARRVLPGVPELIRVDVRDLVRGQVFRRTKDAPDAVMLDLRPESRGLDLRSWSTTIRAKGREHVRGNADPVWVRTDVCYDDPDYSPEFREGRVADGVRDWADDGTRRLIDARSSAADVRAELDRLFAEAKQVSGYPERVDGMELSHRLFDYKPQSWTTPEDTPLVVADLKRGEIVRCASTGITDPHVITAVETAKHGRIRLRLTNLAMDSSYHVVEWAADSYAFTVRLDLLYLETGVPETGVPAAQPHPGMRMEPESRSAWDLDGADDAPEHLAVAPAYRGIPVPEVLWPNLEGREFAWWRAGVDDSIGDSGATEDRDDGR